jgi:3-oxoacyl-[acyl-carrier-protein] synthase III
MNNNSLEEYSPSNSQSHFNQPHVHWESIPVGGGIPIGIERVTNVELGIGGAYGTWGKSYDNNSLPNIIEHRLGTPLNDNEKMDLAELGFVNRFHIPDLTDQEHVELEVEVGARLLREAAKANGWNPGEVQGVLIGMSGPASDDYIEQITQRANIPNHALKVSVHKACDSSVGALHLALNPRLGASRKINIAEELYGKKVLIGGIEGLSRFIARAHDKNALQLFGNGAGVIGVIPGMNLKFLVGKDHEAFDEDGVLAVHMYYPHSGKRVSGQTMLEVSQVGQSHVRVAGLMHEPDNGEPIVMAGPMGMVKLFVRTGVQVVSEVYKAYLSLMDKLGISDKPISVAIVHHANYKINKLIEKKLMKEGINFPMPWLLSEFGNVSAASNMIAFLRQLPRMKPSEHILFDGFGAGTYYDVLAVALGG